MIWKLALLFPQTITFESFGLGNHLLDIDLRSRAGSMHVVLHFVNQESRDVALKAFNPFPGLFHGRTFHINFTVDTLRFYEKSAFDVLCGTPSSQYPLTADINAWHAEVRHIDLAFPCSWVDLGHLRNMRDLRTVVLWKPSQFTVRTLNYKENKIEEMKLQERLARVWEKHAMGKGGTLPQIMFVDA